jgi:orotate phosphoribosyltransferase
MDAHARELIDLMVRCEALRFGDFTAKSGRKTPYFVNSGRCRTGSQIAALGKLYARSLHERLGDGYDVLFGPAYKGIPLVVATAAALHQHHGREVAFCFNRKEVKDHGEGGVLVGHELRDGDRVVIVEDVTTAGTSIREVVPVLQRAAKVKLAGLIVAVDRMERGTGDERALAELSHSFGMPAWSLVTIEEVMADLHGRAVDGRVVLDDAMLASVRAHLAEHGARA